MKYNKYIFYILAFLQGLVFYSSVATLYRQAHGLSLVEMGIIESIFAFLMILFEIPWGIVCDRIGYKKTMLICSFVYFISKVVFYQAYGFTGFLLERILLAFVNAGYSGCSSAYLFDSIDESESEHVFGFEQMFGVAGMTIASLSFSILIQNDLRKAALWTSIAYFFAFIMTILLKDVNKPKSKFDYKMIFTSIYQQKHIILLIIGACLLTETTHTLTIFYNQLQYQRVGIDIQWYGILFMMMQFVSLLTGASGKITKYIKRDTWTSLLFILSALSCFILIFESSIVGTIIILAIMTIIESCFYPMFTIYQNESVHISNKATILSIYSMIMNFVMMGTQSIFGVAVEYSLQTFYIIGSIFSLLGFILFRIWLKNRKEAV